MNGYPRFGWVDILRFQHMAADKCLLPKTEKYDAVHYMLNEWDGLMNIFTRGDYHLDNNRSWKDSTGIFRYPGETHCSSGRILVQGGLPCSIRSHAHAGCKVSTSLNIYQIS